jgi:hypothetical protein
MKRAIIFTGFLLSFLVPLLPFVLNGAPFIGDSWIHMGIAKGIAEGGRYQLQDYSTRWFSLNMLIAIIHVVLNVPLTIAGQIAPLTAGLAVIPLYCMLRRLNLPWAAALSASLFLSFNPLYAYITFSGAVMRETGAFYLFVSILLISSLKPLRPYTPLAWLIGAGLIFAHHYAALSALLFLLALWGFRTVDVLRRGGKNDVIRILAVYLPVFIAWNLMNYLTLGKFFPTIGLQDGLLLLSAFALVWASLVAERGPLKWPILPVLALSLAVLGLRDGLFILARSEPPIGMYEMRDYLFIAIVSMAGLYYGMKEGLVKALASASVGLLLFSVMWGLTTPGFTLLIKSLHYFGLLLAIGAAFAFALLLKRRSVGRTLTVLALIFLIHTSYFGTALALNGLGAYHAGEVIASTHLLSLPMEVKLVGDMKASYLFRNNFGKAVQGLGSDGALILLEGNQQEGFLIGYDWIPPKPILEGLKDRVIDFRYLKLIL